MLHFFSIIALEKILSKEKHSDSITLNIFYSVIEDITDYQVIDEHKEDIKTN